MSDFQYIQQMLDEIMWAGSIYSSLLFLSQPQHRRVHARRWTQTRPYRNLRVPQSGHVRPSLKDEPAMEQSHRWWDPGWQEVRCQICRFTKLIDASYLVSSDTLTSWARHISRRQSQQVTARTLLNLSFEKPSRHERRPSRKRRLKRS